MKRIVLALMVTGVVLLAGCSSIKGFFFPPGVELDWKSLSLYAYPDANRDFPLAVDLVFVSDPTLAERIATMKAPDWFAARDTLQKANRETLQRISVELVPGQTVTLPSSRIPDQRLFAAMVFADYFTAGDHSARLETLTGKIAIEFGATDFSVHATEK